MAQQTQTRARRSQASTSKRAAPSKTTARKTTARKAPAGKAPAKKAPAGKAPAKKAPAGKAPAKKAPAGKAPAGRARPSRNETPNTPDFYESRLRGMKVDELRQMARTSNIPGTSTMRRGDLVKALAKARAPVPKAGAGAKKTVAAKKVIGAKAAAAKKAAPAKKAAGAKKAAPAKKAAGAKKAAPAKKAAGAKKAGAKQTAAAKKSTGPGRQQTTGGIRAGPSSSRSLKYAQIVSSPDEKPSHPGKSLVTTNHDVIRKWAEERNATPATVEGTKQRETVAVLRFDFPWGGRDERLRPIGWNEWFKAFDQRGLNFIYQEQTSNGRQSNFFVLENPGREDG